MKRFSRAAVTAFCASSLSLGGLAVGMTDAQAGAPYDSPSARQALATSVVLGDLTSSVPAATTTTLPLLGAPLTIDVTSGPGGALTSIAVNPASGLTATTVKSNRVRFVNDAGTAKVEVSSRGGGQNVSAKAGQLSDVAGPGTWSGDVFGTGTATTVQFTTVANADGSPNITGVSSSDPTAQIGTVESSTHDGSQQASVSVRFTSGIQARVLTIRVGVGTHDGQSRAKLSVSLSRLTGQSLPSADVAGPHTWNGLLCDGTAASIAYTVNADGTISAVTATPTADVHDESDKGVTVAFPTGERVQIRVNSSDDGATMAVSVKEKIRCNAADPAVNTPVSTMPDDHAGGDQAGDDHGNHHNGDDHGSDPSSTPGTDASVDDHADAPTPDSTGSPDSTGNSVDDHGNDSGPSGGHGSNSSGGDGSHHG